MFWYYLCYKIGLKNSRHFFIQSENQNQSWHSFFRTLHQLHVIISKLKKLKWKRHLNMMNRFALPILLFFTWNLSLWPAAEYKMVKKPAEKDLEIPLKLSCFQTWRRAINYKSLVSSSLFLIAPTLLRDLKITFFTSTHALPFLVCWRRVHWWICDLIHVCRLASYTSYSLQFTCDIFHLSKSSIPLLSRRWAMRFLKKLLLQAVIFLQLIISY